MSVTLQRSVVLADDSDQIVVERRPDDDTTPWTVKGSANPVYTTSADLRAFGVALVAMADEADDQ